MSFHVPPSRSRWSKSLILLLTCLLVVGASSVGIAMHPDVCVHGASEGDPTEGEKSYEGIPSNDGINSDKKDEMLEFSVCYWTCLTINSVLFYFPTIENGILLPIYLTDVSTDSYAFELRIFNEVVK